MKNTIMIYFLPRYIILFIAFVSMQLNRALAQQENLKTFLKSTPVIYINPYIENGSRFNWEPGENSTVYINLSYDYERSKLNRTSVHWHFLIEARKGTNINLIFRNFQYIYNGHVGDLTIKPTYRTCLASTDGKHWHHLPTEWIKSRDGIYQLKVPVYMAKDSIYIASVEPYCLSDLEKLYDKIMDNKLVHVLTIGYSVEGRPLKIIQIGNENNPHRIFIRARVHPWEPGGNWVVEGIINTLLNNGKESKKYLKNYCLYILPMANIDGVARGVTRFNMNGMDLNRNLDYPADPILSPENFYMGKWLEKLIKEGKKPDLAIDFHNDSHGPLILADTTQQGRKIYSKHMKMFVRLLKQNTWFGKKGSVIYSAPGTSTFDEGIMTHYGIEAMVYELNINWINSLQKRPLSSDWFLLGNQLCNVFNEYFKTIGMAASDPVPSDSSTDVSVVTELRWIPGNGAVSHAVYFGESNPPPFTKNQTDTTFIPDPETIYYWRIDERKDARVVKGQVWHFKTMSSETVTDYDGNVYHVVTIGTQKWIAENLKTTHYPDGTPILLVTDNTVWENLGNNGSDDAY